MRPCHHVRSFLPWKIWVRQVGGVLAGGQRGETTRGCRRCRRSSDRTAPGRGTARRTGSRARCRRRRRWWTVTAGGCSDGLRSESSARRPACPAWSGTPLSETATGWATVKVRGERRRRSVGAAPARADGDVLAGPNGLLGRKLAPVAERVGAQAPAVAAAERADDGDRAQRARREAPRKLICVSRHRGRRCRAAARSIDASRPRRAARARQRARREQRRSEGAQARLRSFIGPPGRRGGSLDEAGS